MSAFLKLDPAHRANLVYTRRMPASADFYTNGRAMEIADGSLIAVLDKVTDGEEDFFAVRQDDWEKFEGFLKSATSDEGKFGHYFLRREIKRQ